MSNSNLEATTAMATIETLRDLQGKVIIIDVRSPQERATGKGGVPIPESYNVPLNVNGQPQGGHLTTAAEFKQAIQASEINVSPEENPNFVTHCTAGNTPYVGRGARAAALLRDLGFRNSYNGGCVDNIRAALFPE
jgi:rhodanese-related sulfurtransferase